jgi:16S rRNA (guanine527-N7)-methyltransferase
MNSELLGLGLAELGLDPSGDGRSRLERYRAAIEAWNPAYGLVGASGDELVIKHLLDSLAPLQVLTRLLEAGGRPGLSGGSDRPGIVDLGTGAGLPGIPLSIALPGADVTLLDRMTRRIRFLTAMKTELPLPNVDIIEEQVERAKGSYDLVTFRAFRPFERKLFKRVFSVCSPGGYVVAYKGRKERAREELGEIAGLYADAEILPIKVPFLDDERCVVVMTPAKKS